MKGNEAFYKIRINIMKKLLLTAMISFGAIEASAYSYITSSAYGNSTYTYGNVEGNSVNLTTSRYGNNTSTYGNIGRSSTNLNTYSYGNSSSTYGNIGSRSIYGNSYSYGNNTTSSWIID